MILQPGWEEGLGENGYMYTYGWIPLLFTWNNYNFVNWLYPNTKLKWKEQGKRMIQSPVWCFTSYNTRKKLIKTRYHNISVRMAKSEILTPPNADKDVEKKELSFTSGWNAQW